MPRRAREKSASGIYHIVLRGINRQPIFEDEEDRLYFLDTLKRYKEKCGYAVYAYCLMDNHIHLLLREGYEELGVVFKRIAGSYVYWYNWKYGRSGHLFQDRFKSEPVEDDSYLLTVVRYIHQNPVKAKICAEPNEYRYSSFNEYLMKPHITDTSFVLSMISEKEFKRFHAEQNEDVCLELEEGVRLTDVEAMGIVVETTKCTDIADFQRLDKVTRNRYIKQLHTFGLSVRQINRLTGITRKIVELNIG